MLATRRCALLEGGGWRSAVWRRGAQRDQLVDGLTAAIPVAPPPWPIGGAAGSLSTVRAGAAAAHRRL